MACVCDAQQTQHSRALAHHGMFGRGGERKRERREEREEEGEGERRGEERRKRKTERREEGRGRGESESRSPRRAVSTSETGTLTLKRARYAECIASYITRHLVFFFISGFLRVKITSC
jgi:hypothetical protein